MAGNCDGVANRPSTRNMMICASHDMPSWKRLRMVAARMSRIAGDEAGEIDGEEAGAADRAGGREDQQRQRQHEDRQQAAGRG